MQGIGFLNDPRRLNVALTRARFGIVILGNPKVLSKQPLWNSLLTHYKVRRAALISNHENAVLQYFTLSRSMVSPPIPGAKYSPFLDPIFDQMN